MSFDVQLPSGRNDFSRTEDITRAQNINLSERKPVHDGTGNYSFNPKDFAKKKGKPTSPEKQMDTININEPNVETSVQIERDDVNTEVFSWGNDANG